MSLPSTNVIQDIITRFILTAPAEQLMGMESIMFLVEQAHWYYEDFVREQNNTLKGLSLKDFAKVVFENCPELNLNSDDVEAIMEQFKSFKKNVPVMGGILLDKTMQRVLLVKGWKNTACWGFPRGKIHKNETDTQCAVREVLEETGYDIESLVKEEDYLELVLEGKRNRLYIVAGLDPDSAQFAPKCKGEIGGYAWHRIADLPATREEGNQTFLSEDGTKHKFYNVWPYMKPLRKWVKKRQYNAPDWDMPAAKTSVQQPGATPSMHQPYYPQQVQQLLSQHMDAQPAAGSPKQNNRQPKQQPDQQQAPQQQQQQDHLAQVLRKAGIHTPSKMANGANGNGKPTHTKVAAKGGLQGPLASLFGAAAAIGGGGKADTSIRNKQFNFDTQAIMRALIQ